MRTIKLVSLTMTNFKGEKARTTQFNADVTTICGANGRGKSRHFDAFIWLLFGKDVADRKDYEIKTRVNGEELHKAECSVTGVLNVDGETITLKRALVEDWVKPRGQVEQRYKGNHTECWWNETPVNVGEYDKRVASIVDASVFKMVTNPAFFSGMKWQLQREQLFRLAGEITDQDIAGTNPEFNALLDAICGKSLADYKKEIAATKKRLTGELAQIQPRIDQTIKIMPVVMDFDTMRNKAGYLDSEIGKVDALLHNATAISRQEYERQRDINKQINDHKAAMQKLVFDAKQNAQAEAYERNTKVRELDTRIADMEAELKRKEQCRDTAAADIKASEKSIAEWRVRQDELRKQWFDVNAQEYAGGTTCPHCGQELPADMVAKAHDIFNNEKAARLEQITQTGKRVGEKIAAEEKVNAERKAYIDECANFIVHRTDGIAELRAEQKAMPAVSPAEVVPAEIPGYADHEKAVADLEQQIATETTPNADTTALQQRKREMTAQRDEVIAALRAENEIAKCKNEIAALENEGKRLAQQIADIERMEYNVQQFTAAKVEECERRINGKFSFVTFRLFDYTLEGNPVETCVPLIDGVPYGAANTAARINAGLDIINALCSHYGVNAPIFIDNRESVNELIPVQSQIINLVVTTDNELIIK